MSTDIAESLPKRKFAPAPMVAKGAKGKGSAPKGGDKKEAPKGKSGGVKGASEEGSEKRIRQAVYDLEGSLCSISQEYRNEDIKPVLIDFTHPDSVFENTRSAIAYGISPIVGTTGLAPSQINELAIFAKKAEIGCAIIPNFSVGMVLLQQAASVAAKFYDNIELIEMHHNQKADSPSGTCIKTAEMIEEYPKQYNQCIINESESLKGVRGGVRDSGLNIHSIRLPGLLAHQVVIMGSPGETYTIRHDTIDRKAYMPGVLQAIRKIGNFNSLIYGLEKLIF